MFHFDKRLSVTGNELLMYIQKTISWHHETGFAEQMFGDILIPKSSFNTLQPLQSLRLKSLFCACKKLENS